MAGTIKRVTANFNFFIPHFDRQGWGTAVERNFDIIDASLKALANFQDIDGVWANSVSYTKGVVVVDNVDSTLWVAEVTHTSSPSWTFAQERDAHPTYWSQKTSMFTNRGIYNVSTAYKFNDIVRTSNGFDWYIVVKDHTSANTNEAARISTAVTAGNIVATVLGSYAVNAANASQTAAQTAATNAGNSATSAAGSASGAAASATTAQTASTTAATQAGNAAASATAASNSAATANARASDAASYAGTASGHRDNAAASAGTALTAANNAVAARNLAQDWASKPRNQLVNGSEYSAKHYQEIAAETAAGIESIHDDVVAVQGYLAGAEAARDAADFYADQASNSQQAAQAAASNSSAYASNSYASEQAANVHKANAEAARDLARDWANKPRNSVVSDGEFSSYHWALVAAEAVATVSDITAQVAIVVQARDDTIAAKNDAVAAKTSAETAANAATGAVTATAANATTASNAATAASGSASAASTSATNAGNSATAANTSANSAANSAVTAGGYRDSAQTARTGAETARTGAQTAETNAGNSATAAASAKTLAEDARDVSIAYARAALPVKNYIVNNDFFHQRGDAFPSGTAMGFGFHRWFSQASTRLRTISALTLHNEAGVVTRGAYRCTFGSSNTAAGKHIRLGQRIPNSNLFVGKTVTIAFWARSSVASRLIGYSLYRQGNNGDGTSGTHVNGGYVTVTSANVWQFFTVSMSVPTSIVGDGGPINDSIAQSANSFTELLFWFDAGADWSAVVGGMGSQTTTGTVDITGVFLGLGNLTGLPLSDRYALSQTQRFDELNVIFEKFYRRQQIAWRGWNGVSTAESHIISYPIPKMMRDGAAITELVAGYKQNVGSFTYSAKKESFRIDVTSAPTIGWVTLSDIVVGIDAENTTFT